MYLLLIKHNEIECIEFESITSKDSDDIDASNIHISIQKKGYATRSTYTIYKGVDDTQVYVLGDTGQIAYTIFKSANIQTKKFSPLGKISH